MNFNYPIIEFNVNSILESTENVLDYLKTYPFRMDSVSFIRNDYYNSRHFYADGLNLSLLWKLESKTHSDITHYLDGRPLTFTELIGLKEKGWISCIRCEVWQFSSRTTRLDSLLSKKLILRNIYHQLEFNLKEDYVYSDELYIEMIEHIDRINKFEEYLKHRNQEPL